MVNGNNLTVTKFFSSFNVRSKNYACTHSLGRTRGSRYRWRLLSDRPHALRTCLFIRERPLFSGFSLIFGNHEYPFRKVYIRPRNSCLWLPADVRPFDRISLAMKKSAFVCAAVLAIATPGVVSPQGIVMMVAASISLSRVPMPAGRVSCS